MKIYNTNIHYKRCETTYNEKLKELVDNGQVSLRGLKDSAKIYDELVFDINSNYFEKHGGYKFAKEFYEKAFHFAEIEMGTENIISAVMHADELNIALTDERFINLSFNYDKEQHELKIKIEQLSKQINNTEKKTVDLTQFINNVKKYTEITELTPEILNELIEKILVHQAEIVNGKKTQEIDIYYRGVGIISFPINFDDMKMAIEKMINRRKTA